MNYTSIEQSKKLLELGLNPESADMIHWKMPEDEYYEHENIIWIDSVNMLRRKGLVGFDAAALEFIDEHVNRIDILITRHHDAVNVQIILSERVDKPQHLEVICDAEILTRFVRRNSARVDADYDLDLILKVLEQFDLRIFIKTRKNSRRMLVMYELTAKFLVQSFMVSGAYTFTYVLRLFLHIFLCIKADLAHLFTSTCKNQKLNQPVKIPENRSVSIQNPA